MALHLSVAFVLSLCLVKFDLSLHVGLCATSILKGRMSLAVISDVLWKCNRRFCLVFVCVCFLRDKTLLIKFLG